MDLLPGKVGGSSYLPSTLRRILFPFNIPRDFIGLCKSNPKRPQTYLKETEILLKFFYFFYTLINHKSTSKSLNRNSSNRMNILNNKKRYKFVFAIYFDFQRSTITRKFVSNFIFYFILSMKPIFIISRIRINLAGSRTAGLPCVEPVIRTYN